MNNRATHLKKQVAKVRVIVFGVFDGLHLGHHAFLRQAARYGKVIAVVARDSAVRMLKKREPRQNERQRIAAIRRIKEVSHAVHGDKAQSEYGIIRRLKPDIICLGYDQRWLEKDLKARMRQGLIPKIRLIKLKPHHANKFKSSKLDDHLFLNS